MDTIDRSNTNLPAPVPTNLSLLRDLTPALPSDQAGSPGLQINPRVLLRGLSRHWWRILALWLVVSAPIAFLISRLIQPSYEASSLVKIEPIDPQLFNGLNRGENQSSIYLRTEVAVLTSDKVLEPVVANALVGNLPIIKMSQDPKNDLRQKLRVGILESTNLIRIALELPNRDDAVTIVQAVVQSYFKQNTDITRRANRSLTGSLEEQVKKLSEQIEVKREALKTLYKNGKVAVLKPQDRLNVNANNDGNAIEPTIKTYSENHVQQMMAGMVKTDLDLIEAQSMLDVKREVYKASQEESQQPRQAVDAQLRARIDEVFKKDPDVVALKQEIEDTGEHLDRIKRNVRQAHDAARVAAQNHFDKLQQEYTDLWESKYPEILSRLTAGSAGDTQSLQKIQDLEQKIEEIKKVKERQAELFKTMQVEQKTTNDDTFEAVYLNYQLNSLLTREDQVKKHLEQLAFEAARDHYRVTLLDPAAAPMNPTNDKRLKYMAAAPVGVMFMMLGLFLLLEIKAERVADPDSLSTRVRSEVYSLPPLPTARSIRKLRASDADDQIEQFIQRLDHLRFAVCGNPGELGKGRCVLITSAVGGEGKTTLAAQLAARCGNAGMSTLLIDSDFRRASLCKLLDVPPEGPGLSDVLKDEATIDEVAIPVQGGAFYLLPAGTPIQDISRLLQSPKFGQLISQLRQLYDLIIIDSPPVLPVPDALILGRWADGAVIAARFDISRFPQVERARRQLDNAGIAVLGTVINGMRHSESYYGRYTYTRRRSNEPESSNAI
jgi:succinoglycan biosynthesis transport protein ExoP